MKKLNKPTESDQHLSQFFEELKSTEANQAIPDFDALYPKVDDQPHRTSWWRYAAVFALIAVGFGLYQTTLRAPDEVVQTEIILSYGYHEEDQTPDEFQLEGMDQWQSETDILLRDL